VIDTGLAQIYQSHLEVAGKMAAEAGVEIHKTLLDGKAFQKVLNHARKDRALAAGRRRVTGIHSAKDEAELGSNTENLFRNSPCDILLTTRLEVPELDVRAEESIRWTAEAEERMTRVPALVQGIARTAIVRSREKGHSVITSDLLDEAMDRYMPKGARRDQARREHRARARPGEVDLDLPQVRRVGPLRRIRWFARSAAGKTFQVISPEMVEEIIEGKAAPRRSTYDGRKLTWTREKPSAALWTDPGRLQARAPRRGSKRRRGCDGSRP